MKQVLGTVFTLLCVGGNCLVIRKTHSVQSFASKKLICGLWDVASLHPGRMGLHRDGCGRHSVSLQLCPNSQLWDLDEPSRRLFVSLFFRKDRCFSS